MEFKNIKDLGGRQGELIAHLKEGNARFVANTRINQDFQLQRKALLKGQNPDIIVLTCSDSRVVPHYIFDEEIGECFIIRKAGNVIGTTAIGSIEYAAEHLGAPLFVVLGHTSCGAVTDTLAGATGSHFLNRIIDSIKPAMKIAIKKNGGKEVDVNTVVKENTLFQMKRSVERSELLAKFVKEKKLAVVGAMYDMDSGKVDFLEDAIY